MRHRADQRPARAAHGGAVPRVRPTGAHRPLRGPWAALAVLVLSVALSGCDSLLETEATPNLIAIPTLAPTATLEPVIPVEDLPEAGARPTPTEPAPTAIPTATATLPPVLALPDADGVSVACEANTLRLTLADPAIPVSRIEATEEWLYLLIDGELFGITRQAADDNRTELVELLLKGDLIGERPLQELADMALDRETGTLYLLDKAGSLYSFVPETGAIALLYSGREIGMTVGPQFMAVEVTAEGDPVMLDSANGRLWTPTEDQALRSLGASRGATSGVDLAVLSGGILVMRQDAVLLAMEPDTGSEVWQDATGRRLALSVKASDHLGAEMLVTVDGIKREVVTIAPDGPTPVTRHVFSFADMGLLRDASFMGGRLYAVADNALYVYPAPAAENGLPSEGCGAPITPDRALLYGADLLAMAEGLAFPIEDGTLPVWPRIYPGASRLYRYGIHRGVDIYEFNGPPGFGRGHPVVAMGEGSVELATVPYANLNSTLFTIMMDDSKEQGLTPPEHLFRLYGRQVIIEHPSGLRTVYAHLDEIEEGLEQGTPLTTGAPLGTVGVTGTQGEVLPGTVADHLHFEIWIGDRWVGQGITIREAMWWYAQIFQDAVIAGDVSAGAAR